MQSTIFINYRRDDSSWNSLALYQELIKHFAKENVFKDFNTIEPGKIFKKSIEEALETCDVLLVLISEHWLDIQDKKGNIRINNPNDYVRLEIATALKRDIIVIPVLFDNAVLPQEEELPDDLKSLAERQYIEIDKTRFEADTARLVETIRNILKRRNKEANISAANTISGNSIKNEYDERQEPAIQPAVSSELPTRKSSVIQTRRVAVVIMLLVVAAIGYVAFIKFSNKANDRAGNFSKEDSSETVLQTGSTTGSDEGAGSFARNDSGVKDKNYSTGNGNFSRGEKPSRNRSVPPAPNVTEGQTGSTAEKPKEQVVAGLGGVWVGKLKHIMKERSDEGAMSFVISETDNGYNGRVESGLIENFSSPLSDFFFDGTNFHFLESHGRYCYGTVSNNVMTGYMSYGATMQPFAEIQLTRSK